MKAKFIGDPAEGPKPNVPEEITVYGVTFERGKFVDIPADKVVKFEGNSHFETKGAEPTKAEVAKAERDAAPKGGAPAPAVPAPEPKG